MDWVDDGTTSERSESEQENEREIIVDPVKRFVKAKKKIHAFIVYPRIPVVEATTKERERERESDQCLLFELNGNEFYPYKPTVTLNEMNE